MKRTREFNPNADIFYFEHRDMNPSQPKREKLDSYVPTRRNPSFQPRYYEMVLEDFEDYDEDLDRENYCFCGGHYESPQPQRSYFFMDPIETLDFVPLYPSNIHYSSESEEIDIVGDDSDSDSDLPSLIDDSDSDGPPALIYDDSDSVSNDKIDNNMIKSLTGNDPMYSRRLFTEIDDPDILNSLYPSLLRSDPIDVTTIIETTPTSCTYLDKHGNIRIISWKEDF